MMTYYTNGINEHRFKDNELIPDGWVKGRLKSPVTTLGNHWYNNGINELLIDISKGIPDGWVKGRIKSNLNPKKQGATLSSQERRWYTNDKVEVNLSKLDSVPEGFHLGRLPQSEMVKHKLSESHLGLHHTNSTKLKISKHSNNNRQKAYKTNLTKYGCEQIMSIKHFRDKANDTKRINHTFNSSKSEELLYKKLCDEFGKDNVLTQYRDNRYPYMCDFYIKSKDLFIELNEHWTHGGMSYDTTNPKCIEQFNIWKEKSITSKFYRQALYVWTQLDVTKTNLAKQNNLNYKIIYDWRNY